MKKEKPKGPELPADAKVYFMFEDKRVPERRTVAFTIVGDNGDEFLYAAYATTSKKDTFCRETGKKIALRRLALAVFDGERFDGMALKGTADRVPISAGHPMKAYVKNILEVSEWRWKIPHHNCTGCGEEMEPSKDRQAFLCLNCGEVLRNENRP